MRVTRLRLILCNATAAFVVYFGVFLLFPDAFLDGHSSSDMPMKPLAELSHQARFLGHTRKAGSDVPALLAERHDDHHFAQDLASDAKEERVSLLGEPQQRETMLGSSPLVSIVAQHWNITFLHLHVCAPRIKKNNVHIVHISDSHISLTSDKAPFSDRMHSEYALRRNFRTGQVASPRKFFTEALSIATAFNAFVALGGDIVNFPSEPTVEWVVSALESRNHAFLYTPGNHDWMLEGAAATLADDFAQWSVDARSAGVHGALLPLGPAPSGVSTRIVDEAVLLIAVDNSNYEITPEQVQAFRKALAQHPEMPTVLLVHIPLFSSAAPAKTIFPLMGDPAWGPKVDKWFSVERRPRWYAHARQSTLDFLAAVAQACVPHGPLVAIFAGHVHQNVSFPLLCDSECVAKWRGSWSYHDDGSGTRERIWEQGPRPRSLDPLQHVTLDGSDGGYRFVEIMNDCEQ